MTEHIFTVYYIVMTTITIFIMEQEVRYHTDNIIGFMWNRANIVERLLACALPVYREIILVMVWYQRRNPKWFPDPRTL